MQDHWKELQNNNVDCTRNGFFSREHYDVPLWNINMIFRAYTSQDSLFFLEIAQSGYRVLKMSAFYPFLPIVIVYVSKLQLYTFENLRTLCLRTVLGLVGALVCNISTIIGTVGLYYTTRLITKCERYSYLVCLASSLYLGSVYFTVTYTESIFLAVGTWGCYFVQSARNYISTSNDKNKIKNTIISFQYRWIGTILITATALTRSNGILLGGFILVEPFIETLDYLLHIFIRTYHVYRQYKNDKLNSKIIANQSNIKYILGYDRKKNYLNILFTMVFIIFYLINLSLQLAFIVSPSILQQTVSYSIHCNKPSDSAIKYWIHQEEERRIKYPIVKDKEKYYKYHGTGYMHMPSKNFLGLQRPILIDDLPLTNSIQNEIPPICNSNIYEIEITPIMWQYTLPLRIIKKNIYDKLTPTLRQENYPLYDPDIGKNQKLLPTLPDFKKITYNDGITREVMYFPLPIPKVYSYVQFQYWNVAFQQYFADTNCLQCAKFLPLVILSLISIYNGWIGRYRAAKNTIILDTKDQSNEIKEQIITCNNLPLFFKIIVSLFRYIGNDKPNKALQPLLENKYKDTNDIFRPLSLPTTVPHLILFTCAYIVNMLWAWVHIIVRFLSFSFYLYFAVANFQLLSFKNSTHNNVFYIKYLGITNLLKTLKNIFSTELATDDLSYEKGSWINWFTLYTIYVIQYTAGFSIGFSVP